MINAAQAERAAAQAEINNTPAPDLMDAAEVYARVDMLGDVPAKLNAASREGLADVYTGRTCRSCMSRKHPPQRFRCG